MLAIRQIQLNNFIKTTGFAALLLLIYVNMTYIRDKTSNINYIIVKQFSNQNLNMLTLEKIQVIQWSPVYNKSVVPVKKSYLIPQLMNVDNVSRNCSGLHPCIAIPHAYFFTFKPWIKMIQYPCEYKCNYVSDVTEADAVIIHSRDMTKKTRLQLPRHPDQYFIYLATENPMGTKQYGYDILEDPNYWTYFNWSATYLRESDIYLPHGEFKKRSEPLPKNKKLYNPDDKKKLAYIVASNCNAYNQRTKKVKELQKYMQLDGYGACFEKRPPPKTSNIFKKLSQKYRFYFSFENAMCKEYITEKLFNNALETESVPVVFGGFSKKEYIDISPPNSFIYALDFKTPQELAKHLHKIAHNETKYAKYMEWKRNYVMVSSSREDRMVCNVCKKLHQNQTRNIATDLKFYLTINRNCKPSSHKYLTT